MAASAPATAPAAPAAAAGPAAAYPAVDSTTGPAGASHTDGGTASVLLGSTEGLSIVASGCAPASCVDASYRPASRLARRSSSTGVADSPTATASATPATTASDAAGSVTAGSATRSAGVSLPSANGTWTVK